MIDKIIVEKCLKRIKNRFEDYPDIFLAEEDIRGHLFSVLSKYFHKIKKTKDGRKSVAVHSQVAWYNKKGYLRIHPDISIVNVATLDMTKETGKGFYVEEIPFAIELKLNRGGKNKREVKSEMVFDLKRMKELRSRNKGSRFYMLYLDKCGWLKKKEIKELQSKYSVKIIYGFPYEKEN